MCGDRVVRQLVTLCLHSGGRQRGTEAGAQAACLFYSFQDSREFI